MDSLQDLEIQAYQEGLKMQCEECYFCHECMEFHWESHPLYSDHSQYQDTPFTESIASGIVENIRRMFPQ